MVSIEYRYMSQMMGSVNTPPLKVTMGDTKVSYILCAIVKNESRIITRMLDTLAGQLAGISICDTGSTDNTIELIQKWGHYHDVSTIVHRYQYTDSEGVIHRFMNDDRLGLQVTPMENYLAVLIKDKPPTFVLKDKYSKQDYEPHQLSGAVTISLLTPEAISIYKSASVLSDSEPTSSQSLTSTSSQPTTSSQSLTSPVKRMMTVKELGELRRRLVAAIPGSTHQYCQDFVDFSYNRNQAIERAVEYFGTSPSTYLLFMDADMKLVGKLPTTLSKLPTKAVKLTQKMEGYVYYNVRLIATDSRYRYKLKTHEYLEYGDDPTVTLDGVYIDEVDDGGCKADKFERDEVLLLQEDSSEPRKWFYLGRTYLTLSRLYAHDENVCIDYLHKSIETFQRRILMKANSHEIYWSLLLQATAWGRMFKLKVIDSSQYYTNIVSLLTEAVAINPEQLDAYLKLLFRIALKNQSFEYNKLAFGLGRRAEKLLDNPTKNIFTFTRTKYHDRRRFYLAMSVVAYYSKELVSAVDYSWKLLKLGKGTYYDSCVRNMGFYSLSPNQGKLVPPFKHKVCAVYDGKYTLHHDDFGYIIWSPTGGFLTPYFN